LCQPADFDTFTNDHWMLHNLKPSEQRQGFGSFLQLVRKKFSSSGYNGGGSGSGRAAISLDVFRKSAYSNDTGLTCGAESPANFPRGRCFISFPPREGDPALQIRQYVWAFTDPLISLFLLRAKDVRLDLYGAPQLLAHACFLWWTFFRRGGAYPRPQKAFGPGFSGRA
jgi:hypothetical protein